MELLTQKLFPGIVALIAGLTFIIYQKKIVQHILDSHEEFWKGNLGLKGEIGKFGKFILHGMIYFLGFSFFLSSILLFYQFLKTTI